MGFVEDKINVVHQIQYHINIRAVSLQKCHQNIWKHETFQSTKSSVPFGTQIHFAYNSFKFTAHNRRDKNSYHKLQCCKMREWQRIKSVILDFGVYFSWIETFGNIVKWLYEESKVYQQYSKVILKVKKHIFWFTFIVNLCRHFLWFPKKVLDQNGPYINMFQTNLRNVCVSVILEFCLLWSSSVFFSL